MGRANQLFCSLSMDGQGTAHRCTKGCVVCGICSSTLGPQTSDWVGRWVRRLNTCLVVSCCQCQKYAQDMCPFCSFVRIYEGNRLILSLEKAIRIILFIEILMSCFPRNFSCGRPESCTMDNDSIDAVLHRWSGCDLSQLVDRPL